jgi:PAP2 superfamily
MKHFLSSKMSGIIILLILFSACKKYDLPPENMDFQSKAGNNESKGFTDNEMVLRWNQIASDAIKNKLAPPIEARGFAMIQLAVHDALNSIKPKYKTFALKNVRENNASPDAAVATAAYYTALSVIPDAQAELLAAYNQTLNSVPEGKAKTLGITLGKKASDAVLAKRADDGFALASINPPPFPSDGTVPGVYKSTFPFSNPGAPKVKALYQWAKYMKPFGVLSNDQFRPGPPYGESNSSEAVKTMLYTKDYNEVKTLGNSGINTRTPDQTEIAVFWVENTTIEWNRFTRNTVLKNKMDAWKTARLFALQHMSEADAYSGIFDAKYYYNFWRPITAIWEAASDGNANTAADITWSPLYDVTPPIPDYPSGHSTAGGASSTILKLFFGTDKTDVNITSETLPGVTRHYTSFSSAGLDNALSRIYIGYHFREACRVGLNHGKDIATYVFRNNLQENENDEHDDDRRN